MLGKAIRGTLIIFVMSMLGSGISYLFRILLARELSIAEYGLFYAIYSFFSVLILFVDLGLSQAVTKHVIDLNAHKKYARSKAIILGIFSIQLLISGIIFSIVFVFSDEISHSIFKVSDNLLLVMMGLWFATLPLVSFLGNVFTGIKRMEITSSLELFRQAFGLGFTLLFLYLNFGVRSPFYAYMCINVLMFIVYAPIIKIVHPYFTKTKPEYDKKVLISVFKYGGYLVFSSLISTVILQTDTITLTLMKGTEAVGLYQTAVPLALLITYFSGTVLTVAYPYLTELNTLKQHVMMHRGMDLLYRYTLVVSLPIAIGLFTYSEFLISFLFEERYIAAAVPLQILAISTIFSTLTSINNTVLLAAGYPQEISKNMLVAAIVHLALNILLIPSFGIVGAATSTFIAFIITFVVSTLKLKKKLNYKFPWSTFLVLLIIGAGISTMIISISGMLTLGVWVELGLMIFMAGLVYTGLLFALKILDVGEIKEFIRVALKQH